MSEVQDSPRPRRRKLRRTGIMALLALVFGWLIAMVVLVALFESPVAAPNWLRSQVTERLNGVLPGVRVTFQDMTFRMQRNGVAVVDLRDVVVTGADGASVGAVSDMTLSANPFAALKGAGGLRDVQVTGVFLSLRRDSEGRIALAIGDMFASDEPMPTIPEMVALVDQALQTPRLSHLRKVTAESVTLRYEDARARRGWTVDGGRLSLIRERDVLSLNGDFAVLSGGAGVASMALNASSEIGHNDLNFGLQIQDVPSNEFATQGPALAWLEALRAPISGALQARMFADGSLGPLNGTLRIGAGVLQPIDETRPIPFSSARTYFTYVPDTTTIRFDEISVASAWGSATASGRANLLDMQSGLPGQMVGQFELSNIRANPKDFFVEPITLNHAEMDFRLRLDTFEATLGRLRIDDPELPLRARGNLQALEDGWHLSLDAEIEQVLPAKLVALWPEGVKPKTRKWVTENVSRGTIRDMQLALRVVPGARPTLYSSFALEDADIRYSRRLPIALGVSGQVTLHQNRLVAMAHKGRIEPEMGGPVDIAGTSLIIPDTRIKQPPSRVNLEATSSVTGLLSFLNNEPISLMTKAGKPVDLVDGQISLNGPLELRLKKGLKPNEVQYDLTGTAQNFFSDKLVPGRQLTAQSLNVAATQTGIKVWGPGALDGVPFDGVWQQPLGQPGAPGSVTAQVTLSDANARALGVALPKGMLRGAAPADLALTLRKGEPPEFALISGLVGLGASIPAIGWRFDPRQAGRFAIAGRLSKPARIDQFEIDAGALSGTGQIVLSEAGKLRSLSFPKLSIGGWLAAPVRLTGFGAALDIAVTGGRIDLRRAPFGSGQSGGGASSAAGGPINVALDVLQVSDKLALQGFRGAFDTRGGFRGDFSGRLNNQVPITGRVTPSNGRSAIQISSENAGKVAQAAGILKTAESGKMTLTLTPANAPGTFDGEMLATDVRLRNAPAIGALLDAVSIVGLLDQMSGPGIFFANVDAEFRLTPDQLILRRAAATGPSMGISLDGYYTLANGALDLQGVLSPIYMLNGIGSILTRRGEGLVGFNFNITGVSDSPRVSVNPLSVFTPGMFREIFRRRPPEVTQ